MHWRNYLMAKPYYISNYYAYCLMAEKHWLIPDKLEEVSCKLSSVFRARPDRADWTSAITVEELQTHIGNLFSQIQIRGKSKIPKKLRLLN